ncbi:hypothetical protein QX249_08985 [Vibrio parahaemolyticus]|uniref:Uncharacterized protein n=1 Tax=Vibrio parahaemolyticus TaxID=670 RepID=A0AAW8PX29_VIBPH|nr:hypothetical protein [Vibrio parahaemolyticus]EGR2229389.1 hypothetical protein [Vibrio parahaemolyticus]MDS1820787.1 hypothetical protein [Vibrio parahaemolyticus]
MANNQNSVHTLTYRYFPQGSSTPKTSKLSVDIGIYKILKLNEEKLFSDFQYMPVNSKKDSTKADRWLYVSAGKKKEENPDVPFASYMREYLYTIIIDPDFIEGYEINTDYIRVMCSKDSKSNTQIRFPAALYHALKSLLGEDSVDDIIEKTYANLRKESDDKGNYSYRLRHRLLSQVLNADLDEVDAESFISN